MTPRLGLIVNPIAGMGGRVGLKGTDGAETLRLAIERGAKPASGSRAALALEALLAARAESGGGDFALYTGRGSMGEETAKAHGIEPRVVSAGSGGDDTNANDTRETAKKMTDAGVCLILFAGGDGTARDVCEAVGERALVLGIPAGVKIHSAVFASSPAQAGKLAAQCLFGGRKKIHEKLAEVMDIDEDAYRSGSLRARLFGYLRIPYERNRVQGLKAGSAASDAAAQAAIGATVAELADGAPETLWLIGAGTTTRAAANEIGVAGTLLGVDACRAGTLVGRDLSEKEILALIEKNNGAPIKIVVTPIGGQGFIFGRGNQQFSPDVIRAAGGEEAILVLAAPAKLHALAGSPLLIDTGDAGLDAELSGYYKAISGYRQYTVYRADAV